MILIRLERHNTTFILIQRLLTLCLILQVFGVFSSGQTKPNYLALQKAVAQLMESPIASNKSTEQSVIELRDQVEAFKKLLKDADSETWAEKSAIQHLTNLLKMAAKEKDVDKSKVIIDDIKRDLDLKVQYYRSRMGVVGSTRGLVKVTVRTLRGEETVIGLVVYCNPYRWADSEKQMFSFPSLSSPTQTSVLPGYYRCFAIQNNPKKTIALREVPIGLDGSDEITVDISIPK